MGHQNKNSTFKSHGRQRRSHIIYNGISISQGCEWIEVSCSRQTEYLNSPKRKGEINRERQTRYKGQRRSGLFECFISFSIVSNRKRVTEEREPPTFLAFHRCCSFFTSFLPFVLYSRFFALRSRRAFVIQHRRAEKFEEFNLSPFYYHTRKYLPIIFCYFVGVGNGG